MFNFLREIFASQKVNGQERNFECIILHLDLTVFVFVTTTDKPEGYSKWLQDCCTDLFKLFWVFPSIMILSLIFNFQIIPL